MTVYICDHGLVHYSGHHAQWDGVFAKLYQRLGYTVKIFSHMSFAASQLDDIPVIRHFHKTAWHENNTADLTHNWDRYFELNATIHGELIKLTKGDYAGSGPKMTRDDIVVFPTIVQFQIAGIVKWFNGLKEDQRPTVLCYLVGPSGCTVDLKAGKAKIQQFDTARFYKLGFREAKMGAPGIHFFACGEVHSEQYSFLAGQKIEALPLVNAAVGADKQLRDEQTKTALLYAGGLRVDKGAGRLPGLIQGLCTLHSDWAFIVQVGIADLEQVPKPFYVAMSQLVSRFANFHFIAKRLSDDAYHDLFTECEIVVTPYNPAAYANQTSGILWEGIANACTLVVPGNCWLEEEAFRQGMGCVTFVRNKVPEMVAAVSQAITNPPMSRGERIKAALKFKAKNTGAQLEKQILSVLPKI